LKVQSPKSQSNDHASFAISKLKERNIEAGQKFDLADLQKRIGKKQKAYQMAVAQRAVEVEAARKLRAAYEKASP